MKYHSRKITRDGMMFDSVREYKRWCELSLLENAGTIQNLRRQVKYELIPAQYALIGDPKTGKTKRVCVERACGYVADFVYTENGSKIVEDTKGFRTKDYILKRKMMLWFHGIRIKEV